MEGNDNEKKAVVDADAKELFVSDPLPQFPVQPTQISCQRTRVKASVHPPKVVMSPAVCNTMDKFRQFSEMFANYPTLQDKLTLKDSPPTGKFPTQLQLLMTLSSQVNRCASDEVAVTA